MPELGFGTGVRPMTAVSAVVIGVVLLCAAFVVSDIIGADGKPARTTGAAPAPAAPPGALPGAPDAGPTDTAPSSVPTDPAGDCPPLTGGLAGTPDMEPSEIEWDDYRGLAMPSSRMSGPAMRVGSVSRCFAHTPTGALLAAAQISARAQLALDWRSVAEHQLLPGPAADAFVTRMNSLVGTSQPALVRDVKGLLQPAGFTILGYSDEQAVLALAFASEGRDRMQSSVYTLVWDGRDWRLLPQADGQLGAMTQRPTSLDGFVPWGVE